MALNDVADYSEMKVADLKRACRNAGLPVSGTKTDLQTRLLLHQTMEPSDEKKILESSVLADDGSEDAILEGVQEDAVLGIAPPTSTEAEVLGLSTSAASSIEEGTTSPKLESPTPATPANTPVDQPPVFKKIKLQPPPDQPAVQMQTSVETNKITPPDDVLPPLAESPIKASGKLKTIISVDDGSNEQVKVQRSHRFNTNVITAPPDAGSSDRKAARAERFKIELASSNINSSSPTDAGSIKKNSINSNPDILSKRAERFAAHLGTKTANTAGLTPEAKEKMDKRAERFGLSQTDTVKNIPEEQRKLLRKQKFESATSDDLKKLERAKKFGVVV